VYVGKRAVPNNREERGKEGVWEKKQYRTNVAAPAPHGHAKIMAGIEGGSGGE